MRTSRLQTKPCLGNNRQSVESDVGQRRPTRTTKAKPIPAGYHTATPYLIITNAAKAIEFYQEVFGATELDRLSTPDGKVGHAEIQIGDSRIMLADESPEWDARSPKTIGGSPVSIMLYVEDVSPEEMKKRAAALFGMS